MIPSSPESIFYFISKTVGIHDVVKEQVDKLLRNHHAGCLELSVEKSYSTD